MSMLLNPYAFASGGGGSLPPGATGQLDFVNGFYWAGGAEVAVGDILGGGFDSGAISASGMYINFDNSNRPTPIGDLLSDLLAGLAAGMTILFDVTTPSSLGGFLIYMGVAPAYDDAFSWNYATIDAFVSDEGTLGLSGSISGAGDHKIAITFNRSVGGSTHEYAWCNDGNTAVTQTTAYAAWTMTDAQLGWDGGLSSGRQLFETYIKSMTIYPAMDPTDLPALTA
ncbi:hypothetical protein [Mesorhizobium sp.]|uniref:hypothetical protein n=1 Tax=Mesorhizobium sp. TaxID=1871066 RepID=UPI000FE6A92D|nr:hypothetical protein [Mesorhizobium sp.]RWB66585.1 MAG: hypothetical protein EOQ49_28245 [Mesorhizobium sp.]